MQTFKFYCQVCNQQFDVLAEDCLKAKEIARHCPSCGSVSVVPKVSRNMFDFTGIFHRKPKKDGCE